jgi:hypothetical protein
MKKIIRYLSDLSGVTKEIRKETYEEIGHILLNDRHWFGSKDRVKIHNAFTLYGIRFVYKHNAPNVSIYRDKLDEIGENRIDEFEPITYL